MADDDRTFPTSDDDELPGIEFSPCSGCGYVGPAFVEWVARDESVLVECPCCMYWLMLLAVRADDDGD